MFRNCTVIFVFLDLAHSQLNQLKCADARQAFGVVEIQYFLRLQCGLNPAKSFTVNKDYPR